MSPKRRSKGFPPPSQPSSASRAYFSAACDRPSNLHSRILREASPGDRHPFVFSAPEALGNTHGCADLFSGLSACHSEASLGLGFDGLRSTVASSVQTPVDPACLVEITAQESVDVVDDGIARDGGNDITLAMDMKTNGTLGCAYFSDDNGTLFLFQEVASADMTWVDQLLLHAQSTVVLLPARAPENLVQKLERLAGPVMEGICFYAHPASYRFLNSFTRRWPRCIHNADHTVGGIFLRERHRTNHGSRWVIMVYAGFGYCCRG